MSYSRETLRKKLFQMQDVQYKEFSSALMPTVEKSTVIGIRVPALRKFAGEFRKSGESDAFLSDLPHIYYEENNLHGYLIEYIKDYDKALDAVETFLPHINNWATCDTVSPKVLGKYPEKLMEKIKVWINSEHPYTIRYAIGMLMRYYLDENFDDSFLWLVASVKSDEYYVKMMVAWYFATALAKQYENAFPFIRDAKLDLWINNKAISKACESFRVTDEHKNELKKYRRSSGCRNL